MSVMREDVFYSVLNFLWGEMAKHGDIGGEDIKRVYELLKKNKEVILRGQHAGN